ncbi:MAG: Phospholipase A1 precursor (EC; Outer membrane phospholipase A [uncultured Sulfurovum sp.]|uniref:Phosphatidylcholine 1-acylhydrolase n=1 Tax=uncultured Sulfurovum sp. TaxID=269237 RepID=A0A6S6SKH7_9BACT|nr:MAG: Phospholipase A1 precursor (EC; Outer membrane phospholipase A [uncultured Sulfurovum sp.]
MLKILLFLLFVSTVYASNADRYAEALKLYKEASYAEAYPVIETQSKEGNKEAQFLLAHMYEDGLGVQKDSRKAMYWYKQSASKYNYVIERNVKTLDQNDSTFSQRIKNQMHYTSEEKGSHFAFSKIDTKAPAVKSRLLKVIENNFGLLPYKTNYIAPFSYASTTHQRHFSAFNEQNTPEEWKNYVDYDSHIEAEYQFSFQKPLTYDLFGWNEFIGVSYTQHVWWKIYDDSAPFRETNYTPEVFMIVPTSDSIDDKYNLKGVKFGYRHQSNGQEGYQSRSWDRFFMAGLWQHENLFLKAEAWYRIPENDKSAAYYAGEDPKSKGDDNPDISDYMGYGELTGDYLWGDRQVSVMLRNNFSFDDNKGAVSVSYTEPFFNSDNTYWYFNLFSGYGESLIDYNRNVNKVSMGFAFSRGLFE